MTLLEGRLQYWRSLINNDPSPVILRAMYLAMNSDERLWWLGEDPETYFRGLYLAYYGLEDSWKNRLKRKMRLR